MKFKTLKKDARHTLKTHYFILFIITLILTSFGNDFSVFSTVTSFLNSSIDYESALDKSITNDDGVSNEDLVKAILSGDYDTAEDAVEAVKLEHSTGIANAGIGGNRGLLSSVISTVTSGSIILALTQKINTYAGNEHLAGVIAVLLVELGYFILFFFLKNLISVFLARTYLEASTYKKVPVTSAIHVLRVKKWFKSSLTMLMKYVFQLLWNITIIGGIIKYFSYMMVPYIVAENPDIGPLKAITLSRKMMKGHKWEAFRLFASFLGWFILAILSLGLLEPFFTGPYYHATFAQYYRYLRRLAKENNVPGSELLNDDFLFEQASEETLVAAYPDIAETKEYLDNNKFELKKVPAFVANWFGIWVGSNTGMKKYEQIESTRNRYDSQVEVVSGKIYPFKLCPLYEEDKKRFEINLHWMRLYSIQSIITQFFIFCIIGWAYEVAIAFVENGEFVNRGNLHGPWLPIYGAGAIIILTVLKKFRSRPGAELVATILVCGALEYCTAKYLEDVKLIRYWDYKGFFFNLDGRICLEGLLAFAILGFVIVYLVAPIIDDILMLVNQKLLTVIAALLLVLFLGDVIWSGISPNTGSGISEDLSLGGWPETFFREDALNNMSDADKETLRSNIADVQVLQQFGIYPTTLDELEKYQTDGLVDTLRGELEKVAVE